MASSADSDARNLSASASQVNEQDTLHFSDASLDAFAYHAAAILRRRATVVSSADLHDRARAESAAQDAAEQCCRHPAAALASAGAKRRAHASADCGPGLLIQDAQFRAFVDQPL